MALTLVPLARIIILSMPLAGIPQMPRPSTAGGDLCRPAVRHPAHVLPLLAGRDLRLRVSTVLRLGVTTDGLDTRGDPGPWHRQHHPVSDSAILYAK